MPLLFLRWCVSALQDNDMTLHFQWQCDGDWVSPFLVEARASRSFFSPLFQSPFASRPLLSPRSFAPSSPLLLQSTFRLCPLLHDNVIIPLHSPFAPFTMSSSSPSPLFQLSLCILPLSRFCFFAMLSCMSLCARRHTSCPARQYILPSGLRILMNDFVVLSWKLRFA